jgi:hypothetical protein
MSTVARDVVRDLTVLRRRVRITNWPANETVADQSLGVQLALVQALARYWATARLAFATSRRATP